MDLGKRPGEDPTSQAKRTRTCPDDETEIAEPRVKIETKKAFVTREVHLQEGITIAEQIKHPCDNPPACIEYLKTISVKPAYLDIFLGSHPCLKALQEGSSAVSVFSWILASVTGVYNEDAMMVLIKHNITPRVKDWLQIFEKNNPTDKFLGDVLKQMRPHDRARLFVALARRLELYRRISIRKYMVRMDPAPLLYLYEYTSALTLNSQTKELSAEVLARWKGTFSGFAHCYKMSEDNVRPDLYYYRILLLVFNARFLKTKIKPKWEGEPWEQYPEIGNAVLTIVQGGKLLCVKYSEEELKSLGMEYGATPEMIAFIRRYHMESSRM